MNQIGDDEEDEEDEDEGPLDDEAEGEEGEEAEEYPPENPPEEPVQEPPAEPKSNLRSLAISEVKELIVELYKKGLGPTDIYDWFRERQFGMEDGSPVGIPFIRGCKSLTSPTPGRKTPANLEVEGEPVAAVEAPKEKTATKFVIPRPKSRLEVLLDRLDEAIRESKGETYLTMLIEGIYKEYDRADGGGSGQPEWVGTLISGLVANTLTSSRKDPLDSIDKIVSIARNLMPESTGQSDTVAIANVLNDSIKHATTEVKDTVLTVTGSKNVAQNFGACPNCNKAIPKDSVLCPYCGQRFKAPDGGAPAAASPPAGTGGDAAQGYMARAQATRMQEQQKASEYRKRRQQAAAPQEQPRRQAAAPDTEDDDSPVPQPNAKHFGADGTETLPQVQVSDDDRKKHLKNLNRIASFILQKDDPATKVSAMWKLADLQEKKDTVLLAAIGRDRVLGVGKRLLAQYPEFKGAFEICSTSDGVAWIDAAFEAVKNNVQREKFALSQEELKRMLVDFEAKLGFPLE